MGRDKALLEVGGTALVSIAAHALHHAGATPVLAVGGDPAALQQVSPLLVPVADDSPGEGPLGGLLTAFRHARERRPGPGTLVVVIACDMPSIDAATIRALVDALVAAPDAAVAAAVVDDRPQPLTAAWRPARAEPVLRAGFASGERAPRRLLPRLGVVPVVGLTPSSLVDVDRPEDLAALDTAGASDSGTVPHGPEGSEHHMESAP
jgi:molybdopterin-guanine dinucleotide biosynthesis protein A